MQVLINQSYTFTFQSDGINVLDEINGVGNVVSNGIQNAGFPVENLTWTAFGTSVDVNFVYIGQNTDSDSLGQAMASAITDSANGTWSFVKALAGVPIANPSTPGADAVNKVAANLPDPKTLGIWAAAIIALLVFLFAFGEGLGKGVT